MTIYIRLDMDGQFYVEHLVNASQRLIEIFINT